MSQEIKIKALELVKSTREYCDYLENHLKNIARAFHEFESKCKTLRVVYDDFYYFQLRGSVENHDLSKLGANEFTQYRDFFYPVKENKMVIKKFNKAWKHHCKKNDHHHENWLKKEDNLPDGFTICCSHMVIDWLAMSYNFGDTPRKYYNKNKEKFKFPDSVDAYLNEIFDLLEAKHNWNTITF